MQSQRVAQSHSPHLSRRRFLQLAAAGSAFPLLAACVPAAPAQPAAESGAVAPSKRLTEVTLMSSSAFPPPTPRDENSYWQEIEKRTGVTINFNFVPRGEYDEKLGAVLASGDLPDALGGDQRNPIIRRAILDGAFLDLAKLGLPEDTHGLPGLEVFPEQVWFYSSFNGVHYGVPTAGQRYQEAAFIRQDWLDTLGLAMPTTTDELKAVLQAFADQDPNGNSSNDTFGFSLGQRREGLGWGLFVEPHEVPNGWRVESDGTLIHQDITEQMKAAIAFAAKVYATGVINPDFTTLNRNAYNDEMAAGISGGYTHNLASGYDLVGAQLRQLHPDAIVYPMTPVEASGFKIQTFNRPGFNGKTQIRADYGDDVALGWELIEVLHFWMDPATDDFVNFGFEGEHHTVNEDGSLVQTEKGTADIQWIRAWSPRHYRAYVDAPYVTAANREQIKEDTARLQAFAVDDPTWGIYPELGADDPSAALSDFTNNTFEAMVRGDQSVEDFDQFVEEWLARGGQMLTDAITKTYHEVHG